VEFRVLGPLEVVEDGRPVPIVAAKQRALLATLLLRANQFVAVLSAAVGSLLFAVLLFSGRYASVVDILTFIWASFLLPFIALSQIRGAVLQGLRHVVQGQIPESVIRPGLFMALIFLWSLVSPLRSWSAMALQVGAAIAAFAVGLALLVRYIPAEVKHAKVAHNPRRGANMLGIKAELHQRFAHRDAAIYFAVIRMIFLGIDLRRNNTLSRARCQLRGQVEGDVRVAGADIPTKPVGSLLGVAEIANIAEHLDAVANGVPHDRRPAGIGPAGMVIG